MAWLGAMMCACCLWLPFLLRAAEVMPPAPSQYFNDLAGVTRPATQATLNRSLEQFEKDTSSQIVVAIFPKMQSHSSMEDYVNRLFKAWQIGQKQKNNGVLLAVFIQDRKMRIEVGYGLEGAIPDLMAKRIIDNELKPRFRNNDFDGGLSAAVNALMQAARGEYKGTGRTNTNGSNKSSFLSSLLGFLLGPGGFFIYFILIIFIVIKEYLRTIDRRPIERWPLERRHINGTVYSRTGRSRSSSSIDWSSGGSSGGGSSNSGSFSGGGGDSGGGGASGSW
jgi:uncharacterized protein